MQPLQTTPPKFIKEVFAWLAGFVQKISKINLPKLDYYYVRGGLTIIAVV